MKMFPIDMNGNSAGPEGWVTFDARKLNGPLFFEDVVDDDGFFSPYTAQARLFSRTTSPIAELQTYAGFALFATAYVWAANEFFHSLSLFAFAHTLCTNTSLLN